MARVVVIEDDRTFRELLHAELEELGHVVCSAGDGDAGLALIVDAEPDAVICDIGMPKIDGLRLKEALDESGMAAERMVFIYLSGHDAPSEVADGLMHGADHYFTKPVDIDRLAAALATAGA